MQLVIGSCVAYVTYSVVEWKVRHASLIILHTVASEWHTNAYTKNITINLSFPISYKYI
jgi:hypothetical protein